MGSKDDSRIIALKKAVKNSDAESIRLLLDNTVDPRYLLEITAKIFRSGSVTRNQSKIINLILDRGLVKTIFWNDMFNPEFNDCAREIVIFILNKFNDHKYILREIFYRLCKNVDFEGPSAVGILKLLIDHGMPVNGLNNYGMKAKISPLHLSIIHKRIDFVSK